MPAPHNHDDAIPRPPHRFLGRRGKLALAAAALLALGGAAGAVVVAQTRPPVAMAPASPVAIRALSSAGIVTIRGRVAEIYGNKFIMADSTGRALVDTGREGDYRQLVTANEPVTVQGRFDRGFVRAAFLVGPDNTVVALGPLGRPHHAHCPWGRDGGPDGPPPPEADRAGGPPPPPPPANGAAPIDAPAPGIK